MECRGAGPRAGDVGVPRGLTTAEMDSARCSPFATFSLVRVEAAYDVLPLTGNATGFPPNQLSRPPRSKLASTGDARCKPSLTQLWSASASQESRSSRTTSRTARSSLLLSLGPSIIPSLGARCVRWVMEVEEGADGGSTACNGLSVSSGFTWNACAKRFGDLQGAIPGKRSLAMCESVLAASFLS